MHRLRKGEMENKWGRLAVKKWRLNEKKKQGSYKNTNMKTKGGVFRNPWVFVTSSKAKKE